MKKAFYRILCWLGIHEPTHVVVDVEKFDDGTEYAIFGPDFCAHCGLVLERADNS